MAENNKRFNSLRKWTSMDDMLENCPLNQIVGDNLVRGWSKINNPNYKNIVVSISGGADSDDVLDLIWRMDINNKCHYVWFDTGLEYQATKSHLKKLENKYGIEIETYKAIKPIPITCKNMGQPFLSKYASDMISRLQRHNFKWEDKKFEELYKEYPKCKGGLLWWCNMSKSFRFNISNNKWLKEFMIENPPEFKISHVCCKYAKKDVVHKVIKEYNADLEVTGIRKAEGGIRATAYKSCFDCNDDGNYDRYRPLFWYKNEDKDYYEEFYCVVHSDCYSKYGLKRTGCAGCPFGRDFEFELDVIKEHEPKLFIAVNNIFGDSYEYTRKYRKFCEEMNKEQKKNQ